MVKTKHNVFQVAEHGVYSRPSKAYIRNKSAETIARQSSGGRLLEHMSFSPMAHVFIQASWRLVA
jgi:hypothetical protein